MFENRRGRRGVAARERRRRRLAASERRRREQRRLQRRLGVFFASRRRRRRRASPPLEGAHVPRELGLFLREARLRGFAQPVRLLNLVVGRLRVFGRLRVNGVSTPRALAPAGAGVPRRVTRRRRLRRRHPSLGLVPPGRALPLREREVRAERRPRGRGEEQRQAGEAAGSVRGERRGRVPHGAFGNRLGHGALPEERGRGRGRERRERHRVHARVRGGHGRVRLVPLRGRAGGLAALPRALRRDVLLDVLLAVARLLRPNGGLDAHALRWGRALEALGDLRLALQATAFGCGRARRGRRGRGDGGHDVLRPTGLRGSRRTVRQRSGSRGSASRLLEEACRARARRAIHRDVDTMPPKGRWTCVRRVGARAARRVTVRSCVAVWSCPRISNCQGVFLNLFIPSFSRLSTVGRRRLRRPLGGRRLVRLRTGTRFPVTSRRAATRSCAVGTADAALGPRSSPARSAFETRSW